LRTASAVLLVAASCSCSKGSVEVRPPGEPTSAQGPMPAPGQGGCIPVVVAPPCTFFSLTPIGPANDAGDVAYRLIYADASGRRIQPFHLRASLSDRPALDAFFRSHPGPECSGGWASAPCNDDPALLSGFPVPPIGSTDLPAPAHR
jgi:hypothetical protein